MLQHNQNQTFTSITESDLHVIRSDLNSSLSDASLDESALDETYNPTKDKQGETQSFSNSGESGQEQRSKYQKILWRKKHTIDIRRRKMSPTEKKVENRQLGKEYKGKKKVGRKTTEVTRSPRSIGGGCHHGCNEGQIRNNSNVRIFLKRKGKRSLQISGK